MKSFKILVFGLPGSGKTTLANKLAKKLDALHLNADEIRQQCKDWDFSDAGRTRQAKRMLKLAEACNKQFVIMDFVCPTKYLRRLVNPDLSVFMNTINAGRYEDTNKIFEKPAEEDGTSYVITEMNSEEAAQKIATDLMKFDWRKPTVQMLGRWQPFHDGHVALFKRALAKTGQVVVQVRDCVDWNDSNPFDYDTVKAGITSKLSENGFIEGTDFIVQVVPNITNITYGRSVGYTIEQEFFEPSIAEISATKIRQKMGLG